MKFAVAASVKRLRITVNT